MHDNWEQDLKKRRDPVAHRIPLYVPHTMVNQKEAEVYKDLEKQFHEQINTANLHGNDDTFQKMHEVGTFYPYFVHHPEEALIPIYPTIPTDLAHLIQIADITEDLLLSKKK